MFLSWTEPIPEYSVQQKLTKLDETSQHKRILIIQTSLGNCYLATGDWFPVAYVAKTILRSPDGGHWFVDVDFLRRFSRRHRWRLFLFAKTFPKPSLHYQNLVSIYASISVYIVTCDWRTRSNVQKAVRKLRSIPVLSNLTSSLRLWSTTVRPLQRPSLYAIYLFPLLASSANCYTTKSGQSIATDRNTKVWKGMESLLGWFSPILEDSPQSRSARTEKRFRRQNAHA